MPNLGVFWTRGVKSPSCFGSWRFPEKHLTLTLYLFLFHQEIDPIIHSISGQVLFSKIECDKPKTINKNVRKYSICGLVFIQNSLQPNLPFYQFNQSGYGRTNVLNFQNSSKKLFHNESDWLRSSDWFSLELRC